MGVSATHEIVFEAWLAACFPKKNRRMPDDQITKKIEEPVQTGP
jgi:hypothetical protein